MITFDGFDLDDGINYIVVSDNERDTPQRRLETTSIARREGSKFLGSEFETKIIELNGQVFADTVSGFKNKVDDLKKYLSGQEKTLQFDSDRSYVATVRGLKVPKDNEAITAGGYTVEFVCQDPFAYGPLHSTNYTVTSGTVTYSGSVTISGTIYAKPVLTYNTPAVSVYSDYVATNFGASLVLDYRFKETSGTTLVNSANPGTNNLTVTAASAASFFGTAEALTMTDGGASGDFAVQSSASGLPSSNFSLMGWFKTTSSSAAFDYMFDINGGRIAMRLEGSPLKPVFRILPGGVGTSVTSMDSVTAETWYHVVGVYDAANNRAYIYLNGTDVTTGTVSPSGTISNLTNINLGRISSGTSNNWNGQLARWTMLNRVLTPTEIMNIYNAQRSAYFTGSSFNARTVDVGLSGDSPVALMSISHTPSGETITWSGTLSNQRVTYSGSLVFNYDNLSVLQSGTPRNWEGIFSRWEPGVNPFVITTSGVMPGGSINLAYNPAYL